MAKKTNMTYPQQVGAVAPVFALKALLGDLPKGAIEKSVEQKLLKNQSLLTGFKEGIKGRGLGRALGASMGIATAPLFLKGVQLAGSDKRSDQLKGVGLIAGTAGIYQAGKGAMEGGMEGRAHGLSAGFAKAKNLMGVRAAYKVPLAVVFGLSIAAGRKRKDSKSKYLIPALMGAGMGGISRSGEAAFSTEMKTLLGKNKLKAVLKGQGGTALRSAAIKRMTSAGAGGMAGGLLGGLVLAGVVDKAMGAMDGKKGKKK